MPNLPTWLPFRSRHAPITTIVLHATAGKSASSSIAWLRKIKLSYHYIIERDGTVFKCVPYSRVAFHAGKSLGPQGENVGEYSIGISFANMDDGSEPYTAEAVAACNALIAELSGAIPSLKWITRHKDISPGRKTDPGVSLKFDRINAGRLERWPG